MRAFMYSNLSLSDSCWRHVLQLSDMLLFQGQNGKLLRTIDIRQKMVSDTRLWSGKAGHALCWAGSPLGVTHLVKRPYYTMVLSERKSLGLSGVMMGPS